MEIITKKRITFLILTGWMIIIFCFSAQSGNKSSQISHSVGYRIAARVNELFHQEKTEAALTEQAEQMQVLIRKSAHMGEYALLAVFVLMHICCYKKRPQKMWLLGWAFSVIYAATDEIHQLFVPGRSGMFTDVCIDSVGSFIGVIIFMICYRKVSKKKQ